MSDGISRSSPPNGGVQRVGVGARGLTAALLAACLWFTACQRSPPAGAAAPKAAGEDTRAIDSKDSAKAGGAVVTLTPEQVEKLDLVTESAQTVKHSDEAPGYGVVMGHDVISQAAAELTMARATERLSRSALTRAQKLSGTPGAVSADVEETAAQKAQIDAAALTLSTQKLSSTLGMRPPWKLDENDPILRDLASGKTKLVRVTFPLDALRGGAPKRLRVSHIGASKPGASWTLTTIWDAPADATVPGRSFFALLKVGDAGEGERLQVWAPIGESESGVLIPAAAAVMSDSKYLCYVEKRPGTFSRVEIDTSKVTVDGYFVTEGVSAGDKIVTAAAGQLLAKETGSSAEPD